MKLLKLLALCLLIVPLGGCIRHRMVITSEPSEAMVTLNDQYRGRTPIEIPFEWHWWYVLKIEREGYQPLEREVRLRAKPWFYFPLDLIAQALPFKFDDTRKLHYRLTPAADGSAVQPAATTLDLSAAGR